LTRKLQIGGRVHFAGWCAAVPEILAACELLVLPSRWEGMPNVVLEAMAAGKPVVSARVEGVTELLGDQVAAQTANPNEPAHFARQIVALANDINRRKILANRNQERAIQQFSIANSVGSYSSLYQKLMGG
jgi:starch synthase (maltosyl-transferring)